MSTKDFNEEDRIFLQAQSIDIIPMRITFLGGAGGVTGANHLLEIRGSKFLIDCGLFQSGEFVDELNRQNFGYIPEEIAAVFISHGHLDHVGRLPKLYRNGFRGAIYATPPTIDITSLILEDAFHIMEQECEAKQQQLLYKKEDIQGVMSQMKPLEYEKPLNLMKDARVTLFDAGHILGSAITFFEDLKAGTSIVFSGDFGNKPKPILKDPTQINAADYVVVESAYGNRVHESRKSMHLTMADIFLKVAKEKHILIIPAFSLERTQELLYYFEEFVEKHHFPSIPTFLDSPLSIKITEVFKKYPEYFDHEAYQLFMRDQNFLDFKGLITTVSTEESKKIINFKPPKIIIAGSGMMHAGRIRHHLVNYLPDKRTILLIVGFQVRGTLGRQLLDGAKKVRIFGKEVPVRATIIAMGAMSAHGDSNMLFDWVKNIRGVKKVFVVQGDPEAANFLADRINKGTEAKAIAPGLGHSEEL